MGGNTDEPDADIGGRVLNGYLLNALIHRFSSRSNLSEGEANRIAVEEVRGIPSPARFLLVRVVLDANVFVSALIGEEDSAPQVVLEAFEADLIDVVVSPCLIQKLAAVLARPKLVSRVTAAERDEYLARV